MASLCDAKGYTTDCVFRCRKRHVYKANSETKLSRPSNIVQVFFSRQNRLDQKILASLNAFYHCCVYRDSCL